MSEPIFAGMSLEEAKDSIRSLYKDVDQLRAEVREKSCLLETVTRERDELAAVEAKKLSGMWASDLIWEAFPEIITATPRLAVKAIIRKLKESDLQVGELRLAGQRARGQLREVLKLGMFAPESSAHVYAAHEALAPFDVTEKRDGPCSHCSLTHGQHRPDCAQKRFCEERSPSFVESGTLTCNQEAGHKGQHTAFTNGMPCSWR